MWACDVLLFHTWEAYYLIAMSLEGDNCEDFVKGLLPAYGDIQFRLGMKILFREMKGCICAEQAFGIFPNDGNDVELVDSVQALSETDEHSEKKEPVPEPFPVPRRMKSFRPPKIPRLPTTASLPTCWTSSGTRARRPTSTRTGNNCRREPVPLSLSLPV